MPWCDTYEMAQHLAEISHQVTEDAHAILLTDQAGWHMSDNLIVAGNITILPLFAEIPGVEPGRKPLAVHVSERVLKQGLQILRRHL